MIIYDTLSEAYLETLREVYTGNYHLSSPRGLPVRECINYMFQVRNPSSDAIVTLDPERNVTIASYTAKEKLLYDSCTNLAKDFATASKFWNAIANPDGTINSAYGFLVWKNLSHGNAQFEPSCPARTPWEWARDSLIADADTRQSILRFSLPEHFWKGNKDMVCTMHGVFSIRDEKLHFSVVMRSQDLVKGAVYDWPWFCSLMDRMIIDLKQAYPTLKKGTYTHMCHNIHIYEKDRSVVEKMLGGALNGAGQEHT